MDLRRLFGKRKKKRNKHVRYLEREIVRKNDIIKELEKKNQLLLKTSMKQSEEIVNLKKRIREMNDRMN